MGFRCHGGVPAASFDLSFGRNPGNSGGQRVSHRKLSACEWMTGANRIGNPVPEDAPTTIQYSVAPKIRGFAEDISDAIRIHREYFRKSHPDAVMTRGRSLEVDGGRPAPLILYDAPGAKSHDAVVLIEHATYFLAVSLSTEDSDARERTLPALHAAVTSTREIIIPGQEPIDGTKGKRPRGSPLVRAPAAVVWLAIQDRCLIGCRVASFLPLKAGQEGAAKKRRDCMSRCRNNRALSAAARRKPADDWGLSRQTAIRTCTVFGTYEFLRDLRCLDEQKPKFKRRGQAGDRDASAEACSAAGPDHVDKYMDPLRVLAPGEPDCHIVDEWRVSCGDEVHTLFFDIYHCDGPKPWRAPEGFRRPLRKARWAEPELPAFPKR